MQHRSERSQISLPASADDRHVELAVGIRSQEIRLETTRDLGNPNLRSKELQPTELLSIVHHQHIKTAEQAIGRQRLPHGSAPANSQQGL